jgi:hypothetical protein
MPARCDAVLAVIDTASKTGTDNDAKAVTFFAYDTRPSIAAFARVGERKASDKVMRIERSVLSSCAASG